MNVPRVTAMGIFLTLAAFALAACGGGGSGGGAGSNPLPPGGGVPSSPTPTPLPIASSTPSVLVSPAAVPSAPAAYAQLYAAVNTQLASFSSSVSSQCAGASAPTQAYVELLAANGNNVINTLPGQSPAYVTAVANNVVQGAVALKQRFGIAGVEFSVVYPLFVQNQANAPASYSTANYATFLSYYEQVVQGLRSAGLGVAIETDLLFPTYVQSGTFSYNGMTVATLENGVAEDAQNVVNNLKPDRMILATEPSTIAYNTGLSSINDPNGFASYVSAIRAQLNTAASPNTKLGAGADNWQSSSFLTTLLSSTNLDFYDLHVYPPDDLATAITDMATLRASGKPLAISETWLNKEDVGIDGTPGPIDSQTVSVRDAYSFWANMDAQYVTSLMQLARCNSAQYVMFWHSDLLYSYVDYNATTANFSYSQMQQQVNANQAAAIARNYVSPVGYALMQATGMAPQSLK